MAVRAFTSRRVLGIGALGGVVAAAGCASDFDTSRVIPARGTLGQELYGVVCDRVGAQALHEDLTGASFDSICHADATTGQYGNTVDQTKLPPLQNGLVDTDGLPVPMAKQQSDRLYAVNRIQALARDRASLIAA